ncbi:MAG TPA: hypothetical protein VFM55_18985 [Micromonosporaceae bacterium]|nr:hypothetical protein [Micromonosporaceae bacterium]
MTLAATAPPPVYIERVDLHGVTPYTIASKDGVTVLLVHDGLDLDETAAMLWIALGHHPSRAFELADALTRVDGCEACRKRPVATVVTLEGVDFRLCRSCGADHRALTAA